MTSDVAEGHLETPIATPWFTVDEAASYLRTGRRLVEDQILEALRHASDRQPP
jgi:hypothetical protein